jgi:hypothetical protein
MTFVVKNVDMITVIPVDISSLGVTTATNVVTLSPSCSDCGEVVNLPGILCDLDQSYNCIRCGNDKEYAQPVTLGDTLYFQFNFSNTRNGAPPTWATWWSHPTVTYGWYHATLNPTNYTIKVRMFDACSGTEVSNTLVQAMIVNASVYAVYDQPNSYNGTPYQAEYKWLQNLILKPDSNAPKDFYLQIDVTKADLTTASYYTEPYYINACASPSSYTLEGVFGTWDTCDYTYYGSVKPSANNRNASPTTGVLGANTLYNDGRETAYRNILRFTGSVEWVGEVIEKTIPTRFCSSVSTKSNDVWRCRTYGIAPYMAERMKHIFRAKTSYVNGNIQVNNVTGFNRNNEIGTMWYVDCELQGCICVQDQNCL